MVEENVTYEEVAITEGQKAWRQTITMTMFPARIKVLTESQVHSELLQLIKKRDNIDAKMVELTEIGRAHV